jgi:hypothetical protein
MILESTVPLKTFFFMTRTETPIKLTMNRRDPAQIFLYFVRYRRLHFNLLTLGFSRRAREPGVKPVIELNSPSNKAHEICLGGVVQRTPKDGLGSPLS